MINFEDYFGGLTSEEYEEETREHLEWLKNNALNKFEQPACKNCSSNPKNGGDGICLCILGTPVIY